jgi:hypothetical protein
LEQTLSFDPISSQLVEEISCFLWNTKIHSRSKTISVLVISSLMMMTEMVVETLVYSPFNHLTRLLAREYFIEFDCREKFKLFNHYRAH